MSAPSNDKDLLDQPLTETEQELLDIHQRLVALANRDDVSPVVLMNARQAAVHTWNACRALAITDERPDWD